MSKHLDEVYGATDPSAARDAYDRWAQGYDAENLGKGYRVPALGCALVARHVDPGAGPIHDAGCGTGIVGETLGLLGYRGLVGSDLSPAMLEHAQTVPAYDRVYAHDLGEPLPEVDDAFAAVTCFGALGPGHAPACCMDEFVRIVRPGGHVIFNTRADAYPEQELKAKVDALTASGAWRLIDRSAVFRAFYFVEPEVTAQVYVFEVV